jgi:hypothetical protein
VFELALHADPVLFERIWSGAIGLELLELTGEDARSLVFTGGTFTRAGVGILFIGNPDGVRDKNHGRHHNQRMAQWG